MQKAKRKANKTPVKRDICEERLACSAEKEKAIVKCVDCETKQCQACDIELHREGDFFFHVRVPIIIISAAAAAATTTTTTTATTTATNRGDLTSSPVGTVSYQGHDIASPLVKKDEVPLKNSFGLTTNKSPSTSESKHQTSSDSSSRICRGAAAVLTDQVISPLLSENLQSDLNSALIEPLTATPPASNFSTAEPPRKKSSDSDFSSNEFYSLGLESILNQGPPSNNSSTTNTDLNMTKPPKKSKNKKSGRGNSTSSCTEEKTSITPPDSLEFLDMNNGHFDVTDQSQAHTGSSMNSQQNGDEELISDLMQSMTEDQLRPTLDINGKHTSPTPEIRGSNAEKTEKNSSHNQSTMNGYGNTHTAAKAALHERNGPRSFPLLDEAEEMKVGSVGELYTLLGCGETATVKIVSIFGNTGDGKSYTLNHVFFKGQEVFATSAAQECCTVGVWAAYDPDTNAICIDTEGLLGISANQNQRTRLLLKILAISDVVVYRSCADRLHTDLFQFLGDASVAYKKHFRVELEAMASSRNNGSVTYKLQDLGPSIILFHETNRTNTLDQSADTGQSASELLRSKFAELECDMSAFSSIHYVGTQTKRPPTDFSLLRHKVIQELSNCSVRSARSPRVIYAMLKVLNDKFSGKIYKSSPNSFPAEFFTCSSKCLACLGRCTLSMNHTSSHATVECCKFVHVYDNKVYICKKCHASGMKNIVVPKTCSSDDNSLVGVAKYAWAGYVLECRRCGIIYRSRQHWYGNRDPTQTEVQIEIQHIWPGQTAMLTGTHNAARKMLDGVKAIADTVNTYSSKPARMLGDWVADQVAPPYWVPNNEIMDCFTCQRTFGDQEKKHHCRSCGKGFCDDCTQYCRPTPERGWGSNPVRVCEKCYHLPAGTVMQTSGTDQTVTVRQVVENVQSVLGAVASVAIDYPIEVLKDSARPAYWVPDNMIKECSVCNEEFGPKSSIHHCRACGNGVCATCSSKQRHVPSRGWDKDVRVCDSCYKKSGAL